MPRSRYSGPLVAILLAAECAANPLGLAPDRPDRPWLPATNANGEIVPRGAQPSAVGSYDLPPNPKLSRVPAGFAADAQHEYTLAELVDIAESGNPSARIAWDEAKEAALAAGLARTSFLPQLTASAAGIAETSHGDKTVNDRSASGGGGGGADVALAAISMKWLLFDFGERRAMVKAAEQLSVASNIRFDAVHQKIVHDVSVAFYAANAAHQESANTDRSLADTRSVQEAAEQRRLRGQSTIVEVAQARQATALARLSAVEAHGREMDARIALLTSMGASPLTELRLAYVANRPLTGQDSSSAIALVSRALSRRPDMLAALASQRAAEQGVEAARADFRPKVFLSTAASYHTGRLDITALPGTGGADGMDNLTTSKGSLHAIIGVTVPLYDGGARSIRLSQAEARVDGAIAQLDNVRDTAIHQIVVARTTVETSVSTYVASNELLTAAQTSFDAAVGAYRSGVGSLTEAQGAEVALMNARNSCSHSYSSALAAAANLALATGAVSATPELSDHQ